MSTVFDKASGERRMFFAFAKCLLTPKARAAVADCVSFNQAASSPRGRKNRMHGAHKQCPNPCHAE